MTNFRLDDKGVWFLPTPLKEGETLTPIWVCSPLKIIAITRDNNNENHGKLLEFFDPDGIRHTWAMPMELLAGDGADYRRTLLSMGLQMSPSREGKSLLSSYIQSTIPKERVRCVNKLGWYENLFVFPHETIGFLSSSESIIFQSPYLLTPHYGISGTLQDWKCEISYYCIGNSRLTFAVSCAFASPLLHLLDEEGGGFHFRGSSSGGKTTALKMAASVFGGLKTVQTWRATTNALESIAALHNDILLALDELGQLDPKEAGEAAYLLSNGMGKGRSDKQGYARNRQTWRLIFLSSGEISLPDLIRQSGKKVRAGQEVRVVDIAADTGAHNMFEELHLFREAKDADAFSRFISDNSQKYYGTAGRHFIQKISEDTMGVQKRLRECMKVFIEENRPSHADGQVLRVLHRFALAAAAGELATELKITGWEPDGAFRAASTCFNVWLKNRGGVSAQEGREALRQVRHFFEKHAHSRFAGFEEDSSQKTINMLGYKKAIGGNTDFFVYPMCYKNEVCEGHDHEVVTKALIDRGWLLPDAEGKSTRSEKLPCSSENTRCYRFDGGKMFSDNV